MFGVRWVILPAGQAPPVGATRAGAVGRWVLWATGNVGYLSVVDTVAPVAVDRTNLGLRMASFLSSDLPALGHYPTLAFAGANAAEPTLGPNDHPTSPPGHVVRSFAQPADGLFKGEVAMDRRAVVLLKSSFDPRWRVVLDGVEAKTEMVAPGFVGVTVPPGRHSVVFTYRPYPWYWVLFLLGSVVIMVLSLVDRRSARRAR
jgi:hypothetical protein